MSRTFKLYLILMVILPPIAAFGQDLESLPKDAEKEAFTRSFLKSKLSLENDIKVVTDAGLRGSGTCAYATNQNRTQFIVINPACVTDVKSAYNRGVLYHEVGHHLQAHVINSKTALEADFETEKWTGFAFFITGAPLADATSYAIQGPEIPTSTHIGRVQRERAVRQGYEDAQRAGVPSSPAGVGSAVAPTVGANVEALAAAARRRLQSLRPK